LAVLWYGGYLVLEGELSNGAIVSFILYCRSYSQSIQELSDAYTSVVVASGIAEVLFDLFDYKPKMIEFNDDGITPEIQGVIQFKDISFAYPTKPDVLTIFRLFDILLL
jgi:ABC-type bacteriocin/lantibiotic exporter with double-glycine peptidase domain